MSLAGCYLGSSTGPCLSRRESFREFRGRSDQSGRSLKLSIENWRTWISEEPGITLVAGFMEFSQFQQPIGSSGPNLQNFQLHGLSTFVHAETFACSGVGNLILPAKCILQALGKAILILGLGLNLTFPASAQTVVPPVREVSAGNFKKSAIHRSEATKERIGDDNAKYSKTDASHESNGVKKPSEHPHLSDTDTSGTIEDRLYLSEAFWRGIPTPEGSLMHILKRQLDQNPSDMRALQALLRAVLEKRDMLRALTVVETLLEIQPNNLDWKFLKARTHGFLGELLMAKQEYEELLSLHPLSARFLQGLVMVLNQMGEKTQALELIQKVLYQAISEGRTVEARNLGVLLSQFHIQLGNFEDALEHLSSMTEEDPDDFRPYLCQGLVYTLTKQKDKAKESFKKYMQLCPPDAFDQNYLDNLLLRAQTDKRIDEMKKRAMKSTSRNKKKAAKPLKQPSVFGNPNLRHEDFDD